MTAPGMLYFEGWAKGNGVGKKHIGMAVNKASVANEMAAWGHWFRLSFNKRRWPLPQVRQGKLEGAFLRQEGGVSGKGKVLDTGGKRQGTSAKTKKTSSTTRFPRRHRHAAILTRPGQ